MSIFKETFKDFVFKQLRIREAIIERGNEIKNPTKYTTRFGNPREAIFKDEKINIAAGAFYTNTVHKQCVIRMSSGVDIIDDNLLEAYNLTEEGKKIEKTGSSLAKRYVLEGGIPLDPEGQGGNTPTPRSGGIGRGGAYGSPYIRSDAKNGFGIVPMPGIVDANIRTKSAYGSLRESKVNFVCHNRRQLDVLEMLYMRPGFPILLEWQWSPFISNDGKIDKGIYGVGDNWFDKNKTINDLNDEIRYKKIRSGGNYDGFVGFCKNFEIVSRPDGGYDCTTELIAMGEVLEGLKARNNREKITVEEEEVEVDSLEFLLEAFLELGEYTGGKGTLKMLSNDPDQASKFADARVINQFLKNLNKYELYGAKPAKSTINDDGDTVVDLEELGKNLQTIRQESSNMIKSKLGAKSWMTDTNGSLSPFFLFKGEEIFDTKIGNAHERNINPKTNRPYKSRDTFVRWDFLCEMFNTFVFPEIKDDENKEPLIKLVYRENSFYEEEEYLNFTPYKIPNSLSQTEVARYSKIKNESSGERNPVKKILFGNTFNETINIDNVIVEDLMNASYNPKICLLPSQVPNTKKTSTDIMNINSIGLVFLNVEYLKETYRDMAYSGDKENKDFNLFDYISTIWEDVNTACCGRYNFILQTELENPNHIRVIDLQTNEDHLNTIERKDLFEFKIQSNKSIVRDFNYNTTIPGPLSATIAIAAQSPSSVSDLDQVTFANFSKGIKSRFTISNDSPVEKEDVEEYNKNQKESYKKLFESYEKNVIQLAFYKEMIEMGNYDSIDGSVKDEGFSRVVSLSKNIENQLNSLLKRNPHTGIPRPFIPKSRSAVVPLKFNVKMDGIGGIVIGNIFIVEKEKLPKGYQGEDVAFVVLGESQNITSGQDWTTEISGQLMLLHSLEKKDDDLPPGPGGENDKGIRSGAEKTPKTGKDTLTTDEEASSEITDIIDNGPQVDDVILPTESQCPPGQVWNPELQTCMIEEIEINEEPLVGNTGLTQEQIDKGGLEKTKRTINGHTPYQYAYLLHAIMNDRNGSVKYYFFEGEEVKYKTLIYYRNKLQKQYESHFQHYFTLDDYPSLHIQLASTISKYDQWMPRLQEQFPELM